MNKKEGQLLIEDFEPQVSVTEDELTEYIVEKLSPYFSIYKELRGEFTHWNQTRDVRIDLGLYPKQETIDAGFPEIFFGIEVKCFKIGEDLEWDSPKFKDTVSQCLTYKYAKFGNSNIEPAFILLADNFSVRYKIEPRSNRNEYKRKTNFLMEFMSTQNVGSLLIYESGEIGFKLGKSPFIWNTEKKNTNFQLLNLYAGNRCTRDNPLKPF